MVAVASLMGFSNTSPAGQFLADLHVFGDVRVFEVEKIYEYYSMNKRQVDTVEWLRANLVPYYARQSGIDAKLLKGAVSFARLGVIPGHEILIVSTMVLNVLAPKMRVVETRQIEIGKFGGRRLLNPYHRRNWITGEWVLKAQVTK